MHFFFPRYELSLLIITTLIIRNNIFHPIILPWRVSISQLSFFFFKLKTAKREKKERQRDPLYLSLLYKGKIDSCIIITRYKITRKRERERRYSNHPSILSSVPYRKQETEQTYFFFQRYNFNEDSSLGSRIFINRTILSNVIYFHALKAALKFQKNHFNQRRFDVHLIRVFFLRFSRPRILV